tara:strand:+ start:3992 stop:5887 length:1896 start_codon:yes stop_codon:yes gene_type:complete
MTLLFPLLLLVCLLGPVAAMSQVTTTPPDAPGTVDVGPDTVADVEQSYVTSSQLVRSMIQAVDADETLQTRYNRIVHNPIAPPDTRSPRATLGSFLLIMLEANRIWLETRDSYLQSRALRLSPEQAENVAQVRALIEKASQTLDLSDIPAATRQRTSTEIVLQLQEIFDRIYLPELSEIPGVGAGAVQSGASDDPEKWIIPGTSMTIERQADGPRQGEYLFTAATVERIPDDYATIEALPIISDNGEDTFAYYIYTPGNLIPPQWYELILNGPSWLMLQYGGQTIWQWIALALTVGVLILAIVLYIRWNARRLVPLNLARRQFRSIVHPLLLLVAVKLVVYICNEQINVTGTLLLYLGALSGVVFWITSAWLTYQVLQLIYIWAVHNPSISRTSLDASLLRTGFRVLSLGISILVLGYGATQIGIPIYGVVAGLGVGGLAIALAAQPTLENFIGGLILYADGIVRVGEYVQFDDLAGTVEEIGIRSTRIRALDQTLITVANGDLSKRKIINYSKREAFLFRHKFRLRYDTSVDGLKAIASEVRDYLAAHEKVPEDPVWAKLVEYGEFSLVIDVYANVRASALADFYEIQEELLYEIRRIVEANGAELAIPSSTVYLARDGADDGAAPVGQL